MNVLIISILFLSSLTVVAQNDDTMFVHYRVKKIPPVEVIDSAINKSGLKEDFDLENLDRMDRDLIFMKCAILPFEEWKTKEIQDGTNRRFEDVFAEAELKHFYDITRSYYRQLNEQ